MISDQTFNNISTQLQIQPAIIKAVAEVESHCSGFLTNGLCKILFEPHIFWKQLQNAGINPLSVQKDNEDILYKKWGERPYGLINAQWDKLNRARKINIDAANSSASWGKFQILGCNFKQCGFQSVQNFVDAMCANEDAHLLAFSNYVKSRGLIDALRNKEWDAFAEKYNGREYKKNAYDSKLSAAYLRFSEKPS